MSYKIVVDSCCELPERVKDDKRFVRVPLSLEVGDYHILDDETFNQAEFLAKVMDCPTCPKSACPSPEKFMEEYVTDADRVYVITLSSKLSGSYNSAVVAKELYEEEYGHKDIHIIDSESASCGEAMLLLKLMDLEEENLSFEEIVKRIEKYRDDVNIYFVLDNLDTLRKNGRLSGVKSVVASTLSIKPVMSAIKGEIIQKGQAIGIKKAMNKLVDYAIAELDNSFEHRLVISHCNCPDRAEYVKKKLEQLASFKEVVILNTAGVSSMYANDGGLIVSL